MLKEMRKVKSSQDNVRSMVDRFQRDIQRRKQRKENIANLIKSGNIDDNASRTNHGRNLSASCTGYKMSKAESDQLYDRLIQAQKQTEQLVDEKRRIANEIREYEEMKEVRPNSRDGVPLTKIEVKKLLHRLEQDAARRQTQRERLEIIKQQLQDNEVTFP